MPTRSKLWVGATVCLTMTQVLACALLPRGNALTAISDILCALLMLSPLLVFVGNALSSDGRVRAFWILLAVGSLLWLADQSLWVLYDIFLRKPIPPVFAGDVLLFLAGVPMLAGLMLRPHLQPSERGARLGILDFLSLMLWWVYFYVYLVECWYYVFKNDALYNQNFDLLYVVEVVVLVVVLGFLVKRSTGNWKRFYAYFLGAVLFNSITFLLENRAIELGTYYVGGWYDPPYLASFTVLTVVAMQGRGLKLSPEAAGDEKYGSWMASLATIAVLSLPIIAVAAVLDRGAPPRIVRFRVIVTAVTMFATAAMIFLKQHRLHQALKHANQVLEDASTTDPLTKARNRRFFSATIAGDVAQTLRAHADGHDQSTRDLVFYLIDADNFKEINDLYGHEAGDRLLVEMSQRISSAIRNSDVLVRWGGEEFLVVSRYTDRQEAETLALRVLCAVREKPYAIATGCEVRRTCSMGWAAFPWLEEDAGAMSYEEVLNLADDGLRQAKAAGKNQSVGMIPSRQDMDSAVSPGVNPNRFPAQARVIAAAR